MYSVLVGMRLKMFDLEIIFKDAFLLRTIMLSYYNINEYKKYLKKQEIYFDYISLRECSSFFDLKKNI